MIRRTLVAVTVLALLAAGPAVAAGVRLLEDAWLWDPVWPPADRGAAPVAAGAFVWAAVGTGRLFGLSDLPLSALRVAAGRRGAGSAWGAAAAWQRLGRDILLLDRVEVAAGRSGRWRCRAWATAERQVLAGMPAPARRRAGAVLGWSWRAPSGGGYCDLHLPLLDDMVRDPRFVAPVFRLVVRLAPATLALAWDRRGDGTPLLGGEVVVDLSRTAAVSWRFDAGSRSIGWGLVLRRGSLLVRTSHLIHPDLGVSHRWQLAAGRGRLPAAAGR